MNKLLGVKGGGGIQFKIKNMDRTENSSPTGKKTLHCVI